MESKVKHHWEICSALNTTYDQKNQDYGDSFAKARLVVPNYTLGKLYDKFQRYMTLSQQNKRKIKTETIEDTLLDMANYCIMEVLERRLDAQERTQHELSDQSVQQQDQQAPASISSSGTPVSDSSRFTRANQCSVVH